ncbi:MAG: hypothetical protein WBB66_01115, partial [Candidatus Omnitrophota bacterium]
MPENEIRDKVRELVMGLSRAMQANAMYGEEHRLTKESTDNIYAALEGILSKQEEVTIGIIGDEIAFEKEPFYEISRTIKDLIEHLKEINVKKITFGRGVTKEELAKFNKILSTKAKDLDEGGIEKLFEASNIQSIAIGEIGIRGAGGGAGALRVEEMPQEGAREKYEEGVEFLTKTFKETKG